MKISIYFNKRRDNDHDDLVAHVWTVKKHNNYLKKKGKHNEIKRSKVFISTLMKLVTFFLSAMLYPAKSSFMRYHEAHVSV
jgi:hypothetical protein